MNKALLFGLFLGIAAPTALAQQSIQWGGNEPKKGIPTTGSEQPSTSSQSGTRPPPPPPPASGQSQASKTSAPVEFCGPAVPPPRPPTLTLQKYDPLQMAVTFRGFYVSSTLSRVYVAGAGNSPMVFIPDGAIITISFYCPDGAGKPKALPRGPYTIGVDVSSAGQPPAGSYISIANDGANDAPPLKTCPLAHGTQTCMTYVNSPKPSMFYLRMIGPGSGESPRLQKIIFDVPG